MHINVIYVVTTSSRCVASDFSMCPWAPNSLAEREHMSVLEAKLSLRALMGFCIVRVLEHFLSRADAL